MASDIVAIREKESWANDSLTQPYYVVERDPALTLSKAQAESAAQAQGASDYGDPALIFSADRLGPRSVRVVLQYKQAGLPKMTLPPVGEETLRYGFHYQVQPKYIYTGLECLGIFDTAGSVSLASMKRLKVNVQKVGGVNRCVGLQVNPLPEIHHLEYTVPTAMVDPTYRNVVAGLAGCFNDAEFLDHDAGEVQLVRFSGAPRTDEDWQFSFGFGAAVPEIDKKYDGNTLAGTYAEITVPELPPHAIAWTIDRDVVIDFSGNIEKLADFVIVQRVWEFGDLDLLGLPF